MTWMPCGFCHNCPCMCAWRPAQQQYQPFVPVTFTTGTFGTPRLSDADVKRIADEVIERLAPLLSLKQGGHANAAADAALAERFPDLVSP